MTLSIDGSSLIEIQMKNDEMNEMKTKTQLSLFVFGFGFIGRIKLVEFLAPAFDETVPCSPAVFKMFRRCLWMLALPFSSRK